MPLMAAYAAALSSELTPQFQALLGRARSLHSEIFLKPAASEPFPSPSPAERPAEAVFVPLEHPRQHCFYFRPMALKTVSSELSTILGPIDSRKTLEAAGFGRARLLLANADDATNANITLTARELSPSVEIVATALDADAVDVLELAGANRALPLRRQLGEQLASRVSVGKNRLHVVGRYRDVVIAEFPIRNTRVSGKTLAEAQIRSRTGATVPALANRGVLVPGLPHTILRDDNRSMPANKRPSAVALPISSAQRSSLLPATRITPAAASSNPRFAQVPSASIMCGICAGGSNV